MSFDTTASHWVAPYDEKRASRLPLVSSFVGQEMDMQLPSESALIADLQSSFPELFIRPLREFGNRYKHMTGVWTGKNSAAFADGMPLFCHSSCEDESYDGGVHEWFLDWLESRGWYIEFYDEETLFIVPIALVTDHESEKKYA